MEGFRATLETEPVHREHYPTHTRAREAARAAIFRYVQCWYNRQRPHSSPGHLSPEAFEASRK
jgi:transposase InsO family protein